MPSRETCVPADPTPHLADLPTHVQRALQVFVGAAEACFASNLKAVVLFGSAAEGRLRPTSDVNLIVVLAAFDRAQADAIREPLRLAHAAAKVEPMWLLEGELAPASEAFAVKFAESCGDDACCSVPIPSPASR
jgi:predicted nucleotidyltransferase